ncbi:MAG: hypothetical protein B6242_12590 [Anaerolineaceae bacterium 4572_78]|nr:MAG: hypothetical protein B6242_12590 [Anaerolineaceae bacterium 4572_78]
MENENKETFGDFGMAKAMKFLNIPYYHFWNIDIKPISPSIFLELGLKNAQKHITVSTNEVEQKLYAELVFLEVLKDRDLRMWQERYLGTERPFRGRVDFVFTPNQVTIETPYLVVSEAKKEDFEQGWGQCLMAMKTCLMLNEKEEKIFDMLGIVSTGEFWQFGKLTVDNQFYKTIGYTLAQPDILLGILDYMFSLSEQNMTK